MKSTINVGTKEAQRKKLIIRFLWKRAVKQIIEKKNKKFMKNRYCGDVTNRI
jgi:hypothetical protein